MKRNPRSLIFAPASDENSVEFLFDTIKNGDMPILTSHYWTENTRQKALSQLQQFEPRSEHLVVFTSGSTVFPKPVLISVEALFENARMANERHPLTNRDQWLLNLPLFHVGGLGILFRTRLASAQTVFEESSEVSHISAIPAQLTRMHPHHRNLKLLLLGGGQCPEPLIEIALKRGFPIARTYGMTETCSQVATTDILKAVDDFKISGSPLSGVQLQTTSDGRIKIKTPSLAEGYIQDSELVPFSKSEFFETQDIGVLTPKGVMITSRADRAFKCMGELIRPERIEEEARKFPGILDARVVAEPDAIAGHIPILYLRSSNQESKKSDMLLHLKSNLSGIEMPRDLHYVAEFQDLKSRL